MNDENDDDDDVLVVRSVGSTIDTHTHYQWWFVGWLDGTFSTVVVGC